MTKIDRVGFEHGHLKILAEAAGISKQQLTNCLTGLRNMRPAYAEKLHAKAVELGYECSVFDFLYPQSTENPLFAKWRK